MASRSQIATSGDGARSNHPGSSSESSHRGEGSQSADGWYDHRGAGSQSDHRGYGAQSDDWHRDDVWQIWPVNGAESERGQPWAAWHSQSYADWRYGQPCAAWHSQGYAVADAQPLSRMLRESEASSTQLHPLPSLAPPAVADAQPLGSAERPVISNRDVVSVISPRQAPSPSTVHIDNGKQIRLQILQPLRAAVSGQCPSWILPQTLNVGGVEVQVANLHDAMTIDWHRVLVNEPAVQSLSVESWHVQFYDDEIDPHPPLWRDRPRLDCVVRFAGGTTVRYHPQAVLIWSTQPMPTAAMLMRIRRKALLLQLPPGHLW